MSKLQPGHRFRRTCRIKESIRRHQDRLCLPRASRWGGLRIKECIYVRRTAKDLDEPNRLRARQRRCCRGAGGHLEVPLHGGHERRQRLSLPLHPHDLHRGRRPADRRSGARPCGPRRHRDGLPQPRGPRLGARRLSRRSHGLPRPVLLFGHRRVDARLLRRSGHGLGPHHRPGRARQALRQLRLRSRPGTRLPVALPAAQRPHRGARRHEGHRAHLQVPDAAPLRDDARAHRARPDAPRRHRRP